MEVEVGLRLWAFRKVSGRKKDGDNDECVSVKNISFIRTASDKYGDGNEDYFFQDFRYDVQTAL